ncbi:MAG: carboxypeptidase regulatory-like domain-containing protein [Pyrinomonadaceae bacterium]|nr:carboxypeptidase regulatory-like domain-containing protein [Pyrinomonadaceae bacterium]
MSKDKSKMWFLTISSAIILTMISITAFSQTGGTYEIEKSVTASGGNTSSGGNFTLESTSGQTVSNASPQGGTYQILSGFWTPVFAPTAASVTISGRVLLLNGSGMPRAIVSYTDSLGNIKTARTSTFGYFRFENVEVGQTYIFQVFAKGFLFAPHVFNVQDDISDLYFSPMNEMQMRVEAKELSAKLPAKNVN